MPTDADFDQVRIGSGQENACTPPILDDWDFRGIRIAAPRRVALRGKPDGFGNFARVVVAGAYQFDSTYLGLREQFRPHLLLVATEVRSRRTYSGTLGGASALWPGGEGDWEPEADPFEGADVDLSGRFVTEFFNENLVAVLGLPEEEGEYEVHAELGEYQSNLVRISLVL